MTNSDNMIAVTILDHTYQIKCPQDEAMQLKESAKYVDTLMRKMHQSGQSNSTERLAIIAALNIAHELLLLKNQKNTNIDIMHEQIKALQCRIKNFLGSKEEVGAGV